MNESVDDPLTDTSARSVPALRALALVGREHGSDAVGRLYAAIGERIHDREGDLSIDLLKEALAAADLDPRTVDRALADPETAEEVRAQHREAVDEVQGFGVPTIVLPSGRGIFGPVVAVAPTGEDGRRALGPRPVAGRLRRVLRAEARAGPPCRRGGRRHVARAAATARPAAER